MRTTANLFLLCREAFPSIVVCSGFHRALNKKSLAILIVYPYDRKVTSANQPRPKQMNRHINFTSPTFAERNTGKLMVLLCSCKSSIAQANTENDPHVDRSRLKQFAFRKNCNEIPTHTFYKCQHQTKNKRTQGYVEFDKNKKNVSYL